MLLVVVQVVQPSFSAMLRGSKHGLSRVIEHLLGDFVPFSGFLFANYLDQQLVLFLGPCNSFFGGKEVKILKMEEFRLFVKEDGGELLPKLIILSRKRHTIG